MSSIYILDIPSSDYGQSYIQNIQNNSTVLSDYGLDYIFTKKTVKNFYLHQFINVDCINKNYKNINNFLTKIENHIRTYNKDILIAFSVSHTGVFTNLLKLMNSVKYPIISSSRIKIISLISNQVDEIEGTARHLFGITNLTDNELFNKYVNSDRINKHKLIKELDILDQIKFEPIFLTENIFLDSYALFQALDRNIPKTKIYPLKNQILLDRNSIAFFHELVNNSILHGFPYDNIIDALQKCSKLYNEQDFRTWISPENLEKVHKLSKNSTLYFEEVYGKYICSNKNHTYCVDWFPYTGLKKDIRQFFLEYMYENCPQIISHINKEYNLQPKNKYFYYFKSINDSNINFIQDKSYLLSVLTLTYNQQDMISDCIQSIAKQNTNFEFQHIIVDDSSTDETRNIIKNYASKYSHIKPIFLEKHSNNGENVQALFTSCQSKYAALCDGDDYFTDPLKLQKQVDFLEAHPRCTLCFHPVAVIFENGHQSGVFPPIKMLPRGIRDEYHLADLFKGNFIQTNSVVYRWRFQDGLPDWFRSDLCPGDWYWHLLHAEQGRIGFLPSIMSVYRRHDNSLYKDSFIDRIGHRKTHGMAELETYWTVNQHFNDRYFRSIVMLANGVFADFFQISVSENDSSKFDEACKKYPSFANQFLQSLKVIRKNRNSHGMCD